MQASDPMPQDIGHCLRVATSEHHARLHLHAGFAAVQNGTITLVDYRALLIRLYGFHVSFEAAVGGDTERSAWLRDDLSAVTMGGQTLPAIPHCNMPEFDTPARRLGALYVVEGSTLGGRHLARGLERLLGAGGSSGRQFFLGRGGKTGAAWNAFLARLTLGAGTPHDHREIVAAAVGTFRVFEDWLSGWRSFTE